MKWTLVRLLISSLVLLRDFRLRSLSFVVDRAQPSYAFNNIHRFGLVARSSPDNLLGRLATLRLI